MVKEGGMRRISIQAHQLKVEEGIKKKKKLKGAIIWKPSIDPWFLPLAQGHIIDTLRNTSLQKHHLAHTTLHRTPPKHSGPAQPALACT